MKFKFSSLLPLVFVMVLVTLVTDNRPPEQSAFGGRGAKPTTTIIGHTPYRGDPAAASQNALVIPQTTQSQSARVTHKG
jgi:hypothetical protein